MGLYYNSLEAVFFRRPYCYGDKIVKKILIIYLLILRAAKSSLGSGCE